MEMENIPIAEIVRLDFLDLSNYSIDTNGNIFSHNYLRTKRTKQLKTYKLPSGYLAVKLIDDLGNKKSYYLHRLVCLAFLNGKGLPSINHLNGIKNDNRLINLEWCSNRDNQLHAYRIGLKKTKLNKEQFLEVKNLLKNNTERKVAELMKISRGCICRIKRGESCLESYQ